MLKSIALAGFFFFASAVSTTVSQAPAPFNGAAKIAAPTAPVPQGFCPTSNGKC
jgi:hypothetical protein